MVEAPVNSMAVTVEAQSDSATARLTAWPIRSVVLVEAAATTASVLVCGMHCSDTCDTRIRRMTAHQALI